MEGSSKHIESVVLSAFALIVTSLIVHMALHHYVNGNSTIIESDASNYSALARSLVLQGSYTVDGHVPFVDREPGFPLFISIIYRVFGIDNTYAVFVAQILLFAAAALFFSRSVHTMLSRRASLITLSLLVFLPSVFNALFVLNREALALSLAMLCAACCLRMLYTKHWGNVAGAGTSLGFLILTYIPFLFLPLFLAGALVFARVPWGRVLAVVLISVAIVVPWGIRNQIVVGRPCLTSCSRGALYWYVRGEQAEHVHGMEPLLCLWSEYVSRDWTGRSPDCSFNAVKNRRWPHGYVNGTKAEDAQITREAWGKILQHFPSYLWFSVFEVLELHLPYVGGLGRLYNVLALAGSVLLYVGCCFSCGLLRRRESWLIVAFPLYATIVFSLTDATPRYLIPVIFAYALFAGFGYDALLKRLCRT